MLALVVALAPSAAHGDDLRRTERWTVVAVGAEAQGDALEVHHRLVASRVPTIGPEDAARKLSEKSIRPRERQKEQVEHLLQLQVEIDRHYNSGNVERGDALRAELFRGTLKHYLQLNGEGHFDVVARACLGAIAVAKEKARADRVEDCVRMLPRLRIGDIAQYKPSGEVYAAFGTRFDELEKLGARRYVHVLVKNAPGPCSVWAQGRLMKSTKAGEARVWLPAPGLHQFETKCGDASSRVHNVYLFHDEVQLSIDFPFDQALSIEGHVATLNYDEVPGRRVVAAHAARIGRAVGATHIAVVERSSSGRAVRLLEVATETSVVGGRVADLALNESATLTERSVPRAAFQAPRSTGRHGTARIAPAYTGLGGGGAGSRPARVGRGKHGILAARDCLLRGDQWCAIHALEGHTANSADLSLLIETYRAAGDIEAAERNMRELVKRYPTSRAASRYSKYLRARTPVALPTAVVSPIQAARACLSKGDTNCAVRVLEGEDLNQAEMALLIESYRALGRLSAAVPHMRAYVVQYPGTRQVASYRRLLSQWDAAQRRSEGRQDAP